MRRFGVHALQMGTNGSGITSIILIPGVTDALKARDLLIDIDRIRENG